jgi:hypothetical protein
MVSVTRYFRNRIEDPDNEATVALGFENSDSETLDPEARAAIEYLKSVREESRQQPFATVAEINGIEVSEKIRSDSGVSVSSSQYARPESLRDAIIEYFVSLRDLVRKDDVEKSEVLVDFGPDMSVLTGADVASISSGIEDLSEVLDELDEDTISNWLFALLVHAELPLLEDTAAALQVLRRYCENRSQQSARLEVSAIIIREYFSQR